jgi:hypothetical protein
MNLKQATVTTLAVSLLMGATAHSAEAFDFGDIFGKKEGKKHWMEMMHKKGGEMQKIAPSAEVQALFDELKVAREAGDEEKVTALREQIKAQHEAEMSKKEAEMEAALAGGYEAWKAYATAQDMPEEILDKITAENFSLFVEVHATRKKLRDLEEQLGIKGFGAPHVFMKMKQ